VMKLGFLMILKKQKIEVVDFIFAQIDTRRLAVMIQENSRLRTKWK